MLLYGWQDSLMVYQLIGNSDLNSEVGVILPTYGEADNIAKLIDDIENLKLDVSILVIDDSSPDGTAELVKQKQSEYPQVMPVSYTHLRAHETDSYLVCRLLLEKK